MEACDTSNDAPFSREQEHGWTESMDKAVRKLGVTRRSRIKLFACKMFVDTNSRTNSQSRQILIQNTVIPLITTAVEARRHSLLVHICIAKSCPHFPHVLRSTLCPSFVSEQIYSFREKELRFAGHIPRPSRWRKKKTGVPQNGYGPRPR
ncbi:unnamed protein product [Ectocarpus fasciculatus]